MIEHIRYIVPEGVWDCPLAIPPLAPGDSQNISNRQMKLILEEGTEQQIKMAEEAQLAQQKDLSWPRPVANHQAALYGYCDEARGGKDRVIPTYQYLLLYDEDKFSGYFEPTKTGTIIPPTLPLIFMFDITSAIMMLLNLKGVFLGLSTDNKIHILPILLGSGLCILSQRLVMTHSD